MTENIEYRCGANMDIFNRRRVEELEKELANAERKNKNLRTQLEYAEDELRGVLELKTSIPEGCTPGEYCRACEFAKDYYYDSYVYGVHHTIIQGTLCGKGQACTNFIQKKTER